MTRRIISLLLCAVLVIGLLPTVVFAGDGQAINFSVDVTGIEGELPISFSAWYYGDGKEETPDENIQEGTIPLSKDGQLFFGLLGTLDKSYIPTDKVFLGVKINGNLIATPTTGSSYISIAGLSIQPEIMLDEGIYLLYFAADSTEETLCQNLRDYCIKNGIAIEFLFEDKQSDPSTATYKATVDETNAQYATTAYYGVKDGADKWRLTATSAPDGQVFDYWTGVSNEETFWDESWNSKDNPLNVELKQDVTFTPHFKQMDMSLLDVFKLNTLYVEADPNNGQVTPVIVQNETPGLYSNLITDSSCVCYLTFSVPNKLAEKDAAKFVVRLYAGDSVDESKALGRTEFIVGTLNAGNHYFKMRLDDIPNDMTQITAAVDFTTNAGARKTETRT